MLDDDEGSGGYIEHKQSGERTPMYIKNGVYMFDLWVDVGASMGFTRPGHH